MDILVEKFHLNLEDGLFVWMYLLVPVISIMLLGAIFLNAHDPYRRTLRISMFVAAGICAGIECFLVRFFDANIQGIIYSFSNAIGNFDVWLWLNFAVIALLFFAAIFAAWSSVFVLGLLFKRNG